MLSRSIGAAALIVGLLAAGVAGADCPTAPELRVPPPPAAPLNIDMVKRLLREYHDKDYAADMAAVFAAAQAYVERRAGEVKNPAVVLDIDETSLSNWPNISADDFGFIGGGRCDDLPSGPCGFDAWILLAKAEAFPPALKFFNAAKSNIKWLEYSACGVPTIAADGPAYCAIDHATTGWLAGALCRQPIVTVVIGKG